MRWSWMFCGIVAAVTVRVVEGDLLEQSQVTGGLVVVAGCDSPTVITQLAGRPQYLVQAIDSRPDRVAAAREALVAADKYTPATVALSRPGELPYVDNLVNLLIVQPSFAHLPRESMLRVLAPGGVAMIGRREGWIRVVKPVPATYGQWSHFMHDATGVGVGDDAAVGRPGSIQWKAGPDYSRSHENMSSVSAVVTAGGRLFSIMDEGPAASIYLPARWKLTARDAYSGVTLWKKPIAVWHARLFPLKSGPQQLTRRLVATPDRVYVTIGLDAPVSELDAATGRVLRTFPETAHAEELLHVNDTLVVVTAIDTAATPFRGAVPAARRGHPIDGWTINLRARRRIVAVDLGTGRSRWISDPVALVPLTTVSDGRRVYCARGSELVAYDQDSGAEVWTVAAARKPFKVGTASSPTVLVHDGVVYLAWHGQLSARRNSDGKLLWTADCGQGGYKAPAAIFVIDQLIWDVDVGGEPYRPDADRSKVSRIFRGFDLKTGTLVRKIAVTADEGYGIMHHRCHLPRASGSSIITSFPGIEFFNVATGETTHDSWLRGACLFGFVPANGLIYAPPHPCACYTQGKLTGFWAVAPRRPDPPVAELNDRLQRGPGYGQAVPEPTAAATMQAWATYRGDAARSGTTTQPVDGELKLTWKADVGSRPSPCTVADGRTFVALPEESAVAALDARTGEPCWKFIVSGSVDSPPTWYRGRLLFGSRDGFVYCLNASSGQLIWRFRAANADRRCVAGDRVESVWPVHGSVLVSDDVLWCCAGRSSFLDGGLRVYRLDPISGRMLSVTPLYSLDREGRQPAITSTIFSRLEMQGAKNDILSAAGDHVFLRHWAFDRNGRTADHPVAHLFSPTGFLDTTWFRRTYWLFGWQYVSGAQGWARAGNALPSGRLLALDDEWIYGYGRSTYPGSPGSKHQMYLMGEHEQLFVTRRVEQSESLESAAKSGRRRQASTPGVAPRWSRTVDLRVLAMAVAGRGDQQRWLIAGTKGDWRYSQDAMDAKDGSALQVVSTADGSTLADLPLPAAPVFDGLSVTHQRVYLSLANGQVLCLSAP